MDELIAFVGGSWQALLVYPGLLAGLLLAGMMHAVWSIGRPGAWHLFDVGGIDPPAILAIAAALLVLALLPVPHSSWQYPIDVIVALALLEVPHWVRLQRRLRARLEPFRLGAAAEAAALLNVYVILALAIAAMGQATGSLLLNELRGGRQPLWWAGFVAWTIALPPLLALGPWQMGGLQDYAASTRRVAHISLLISVALPGGEGWGHGVIAAAALAGFGALSVLHYLWRGRAEFWERFQPLIALALLGALLYSGTETWAARLR